ncbi:hypothetical protein EVAR_65382_1 [Eumeta japonica]|uniref:Uncharacterized protein n=1 Tax=Eumeta variegata TaxID=151549 RepID=A0A4C2A069_EUMVA|nr:hypothetical protein EVAR_65382_1 [Eumeta japonica]
MDNESNRCNRRRKLFNVYTRKAASGKLVDDKSEFRGESNVLMQVMNEPPARERRATAATAVSIGLSADRRVAPDDAAYRGCLGSASAIGGGVVIGIHEKGEERIDYGIVYQLIVSRRPYNSGGIVHF